MKIRSVMMICMGIAFIGALLYVTSSGGGAQTGNTVYDPDPNHLWNRLNDTLFIRTAPDGKKYGADELDILYWYRTKHLLEGASHKKAIAILDEFIDKHGEKLIHDPLKRALLQRDLWELFDWSALPGPNAEYAAGRRELQKRLVIVMRRLALTSNEIASLPNNYAQAERDNLPNLPQDLFQTNGDWVSLAPDPNGFTEIAPTHDHYPSFSGCSPFLVMIREPGGRQAATNYLNKLDAFQRVWVYQTNEFDGHETLNLGINPNLPQFPAKTEFALVRQMCVIDADGHIVPTPITESIQVRRYVKIKRTFSFSTISNNAQQFFVFRMHRKHNAALWAVSSPIKNFSPPFMSIIASIGNDPFEAASNQHAPRNASAIENESHKNHTNSESTVLASCVNCHQAAGIYSVNSYIRLFGPRFLYPPKLYAVDPKREIEATIDWKGHQFNWGLLQGLWVKNE